MKRTIASILIAAGLFGCGAATANLWRTGQAEARLIPGTYQGSGCQEDEIKWVDAPNGTWGCIHVDTWQAVAEDAYGQVSR